MLTVSCEQRILPGAGNGSSTGVLIVLVHQATPTDKHGSSNLLNTTTHETHPMKGMGEKQQTVCLSTICLSHSPHEDLSQLPCGQ